MNHSIFTIPPAKHECDPYYFTYINQVPPGSVLETLGQQREDIVQLMNQMSVDQSEYAYAPGKWTVKEVLGHVFDMEWVFTGRALSFARGIDTTLPGVDQDKYIEGANFGQRSLESMSSEFDHLRRANCSLFSSFDQSVLDKHGTASGCEFTVRAVMFIVAGHAKHHMDVLRKQYL